MAARKSITQGWAERISAAWNGALASIIQTGRLLEEARAALPHGAWLKMIETDLPFGKTTAFRLRQIAADDRITNVAHGHLLPPSWRTLYVLTRLNDKEFSEAITSGKIKSDMMRVEADALVAGCDPEQEESEAGQDIEEDPGAIAREEYYRLFRGKSTKVRAAELQRCVAEFCYSKKEETLRQLEKKIGRQRESEEFDYNDATSSGAA